MKNFIEVHAKGGNLHLINVNHIVEVIDQTVYTDDTFPDATDYSHTVCTETYEEIKALIEKAVEP